MSWAPSRSTPVCCPFARVCVKASSCPAALLPNWKSLPQVPVPVSVYHVSMVTPVAPKFPPISTGLVKVIRLASIDDPRPVRLSCPEEMVAPPSRMPVLPPTESVASVSNE